MNGDLVRTRGLIAVAVGAGVIIGAAGVFLYQQLFGERKRLLLQQDIYQLAVSVSEIRREMENLRAVENKLKRTRSRYNTSNTSIVTDAETEMFSTVGTDDLDDEFYDFSSDENILDQDKEPSDELKDIDGLLTKSLQDKIKAYGMLLDMLEKDDTNINILWRLGKVCHLLGSAYGCEGNNTKKQEFILKGVQFGEKAIARDSSCSNAHKWYAICVGARGQFQGIKDKIQDGYLFKKHVETAIEINPEDPTLHHLLGRFKYEVATLTWIERKVAKTLFGEIPSARFDEAIVSLLKAEELNDIPWKENKLLIAKCYIGESDYKKTLEWLDKAAKVTNVSPEDEVAEKEIQVLLKKYATYRVLA